MKRVLSVVRGLLHPPKWMLLSVPPAVFAVLADLFAQGRTDSMAAYLLYGLSAYCLLVWLLPLPGLVRRTKAAALRQAERTAFGRRYLRDAAFRGRVGLLAGTVTSLFYAGFRAAAGVWYASGWSFAIAAYYLALGLLRLSLLVSGRREEAACARHSYRRTAWLLFLLNLPMGGMMLLTVLTDACYSYPGYVIYLSALYTFYTACCAIGSLIRHRRQSSPILAAARVLNLIAALMSVLGLQTAMLAQFSAQGGGFRTRMNAMTGGGVWTAVILLAVCMLRRSRKTEEGLSVEPCGK